MKAVGLITEYNPFHLGHKYHIEQAKKLTGADIAVVIMSGNYVQRGTPAFADKYTRTNVALNNGADVVIELPYCFACASAEYFAYAAVSILDRLNIIDYLCFGAENDDMDKLFSIAKILSDEPEEFSTILKQELKTGISFPAARERALNIHTKGNCADIISSPNNILGIEYIKALIRLKSSIKPVALKRINADYHATDNDSRFYSATAIRENINVKSALADIDCSYLDNYKKTYPITADDFSLILGSALTTHIKNNTLDKIFGITEVLENRINNNLHAFLDFSSFTELLKTKNLGYTNISRALLHCILNINTNLIDICLNNGICDFIRILGFRSDASHVLGEISKRSELAILTKLSDKDKILKSLRSYNNILLDGWLYADSLYRLVAVNKYKHISPTEFTNKMLKK